MLRLMLSESWAKSPPVPWELFCEIPGSCYTCGTALAHILQIQTQIPHIRISSGHQLCQIFKILTSREAEDTGIVVQVEGL